MLILDILNIKKIKIENEKIKIEYNKLRNLFNEIGADKIIDINEKINEFTDRKIKIEEEIKLLTNALINIENELEQKKKQIIVVDDDISYESFALYKPHFHFTTSIEYKERLSIIRDKQKYMIKNGTAATGSQNWTVNDSKSQGKKMVNDMVKLVLRSFNNECDYCVDNVRFNTIDTNEKRITQSFEALNKLGYIMQVYISDEYKKLKLDELYLAFEYQTKKQAEKEEQKKVREELREQAKLEQEIRQAREKIVKERKHFAKALKEIEVKISNTTDDKDLRELNIKLAELKNNNAELDKEESLIDYREKNAKAGYVYIISNIGAFGENIYKIGMTRRLEPLERVDELGDASVPFSFDVHAMIFSDDAPALENKLHQHFFKNRINKLNNRKEFFYANIKDIEKVVKENYNKIVDIVEIPPAEEYRESLLIKE